MQFHYYNMYIIHKLAFIDTCTADKQRKKGFSLCQVCILYPLDMGPSTSVAVLKHA